MATTPNQPTVRELLQWAGRILEHSGLSSPGSDARQLLQHVTACSPAQLLLRDTLTADEQQVFRAEVMRRSTREPLQYIIGTAPFLDFEVEVGPGVFIPRPETEQLADWVVTSGRVSSPHHILDLCSGSGVLAIAMAHSYPDAKITAIELSDEALPYLYQNVHNLAPDVEVVKADASEDLVASGVLQPGTVDLIVCNPPYVPTASLEEGLVDVETAQYDPQEAVFSGRDGVAFTRRLCDHLPRYLANGGVVAVEHDDANGGETAALLSGAGLQRVEQHCDLANRPRFVTGVWG